MAEQAAHGNHSRLTIDPQPRFELSPYLFMQFTEPLGTTDSSVEAGWDFQRDSWREDLIEVTQQLAPTLIRWGGCLSSYYRWKEGVGPRDQRVPMLNLLWGGVETNQVGTHEFVGFCRQVGADPLLCVNFESDGRQRWAYPLKGGARSAGPEEAAEWVDYCNNPDNRLRREHGKREPYNVHLWQIGNETSYDPNGYDLETAARRTLAFAKAMHKADPSIALIGWGDDGWAARMLEVAGEELQYIAYHHMFSMGKEEPAFDWTQYRADPIRTWELLINACKVVEAKIKVMRESVADYDVPLALTESHFSLPARNRCEVLSSWAAGVAYARILNVHARNGDILKIATSADFCGTRWMVNAIMIPVPRGVAKCYMMPVASVMALYRRYGGRHAVDVTATPDGLDVTASRTDDVFYLHVVNTNQTQAVLADLEVTGLKIESGRLFQIAAEPTIEIDETKPALFAPSEHSIPQNNHWQFPAASVTAVEMVVEEPECFPS